MYVFSSFRTCSRLVAECLSENGSEFHTVGADRVYLGTETPFTQICSRSIEGSEDRYALQVGPALCGPCRSLK